MDNLVLPGTEQFKAHSERYSYITPYGGSYYVNTTRLTTHHYQSLVDRGWRRSGQIMYLPDPRRSCCPHYTIRLPVADFKPTKDQRQAINRWNRHILGPKYTHEAAKVKPKSREEKKREQSNGFDFVKAVHESESDQLVEGVQPEMKYEVRLENDDFTEEKYKLFEQYQRLVHHEGPTSISRNGFKRFLCSSPLVRETRTLNVPADLSNPTRQLQQRLGSYHQLHRLNGTLIALSVLDLLPHGVSAVYFIYDVSLSAFSLGKISALHEAALAAEHGYQYYYMGYYIHGCPKMRYKNDYRPQYFLDWESHDWDRLDEDALTRLDAKKYVSMSRERRLDAGEREEALPFPTVPEAENAGTNLSELRMPGLTPLAELVKELKLGSVLASVKMPGGGGLLRRSKGVVAPVGLLSGWDGDVEEEGFYLGSSTALVSSVAELCAAVGSEVAREMVVDLGGGVVDG